MKKKILIGFAALAIAAVATLEISFNTQKSDLSAVSWANVEALAQQIALAHNLPEGGGYSCSISFQCGGFGNSGLTVSCTGDIECKKVTNTWGSIIGVECDGHKTLC